jgi:hypothetical protein
MKAHKRGKFFPNSLESDYKFRVNFTVYSRLSIITDIYMQVYMQVKDAIADR